MSNSDEDVPLSGKLPAKLDTNPTDYPVSYKNKSSSKIRKELAVVMDKKVTSKPKEVDKVVSIGIVSRGKTSKVRVESDEDDDEPIVKRANVRASSVKGQSHLETSSSTAKRDGHTTIKDESDSDTPLSVKPPTKKRKGLNGAVKPKHEYGSEDEPLSQKSAIEHTLDPSIDLTEPPMSESEDEMPLKKKKKNQVKKVAAKDVKKIAKKETHGAEVRAEAAKSQFSKVKKEFQKENKGNSKSKEEEGEEEEEYKWWEQEGENDGSVKWSTMQHNGVIFPPLYEPLPSNIKMKYDDKPISLPSDAEEVAGFFGALLESDHAQNPTFTKNFFEDFQKICKESREFVPASFNRCNFRPMFEYFEAKKEEKKAMNKDQKKALKLEKEKIDEQYKFCIVDGRKEKVGNFRIEPPGLFRGRGAHPKTGRLKTRVLPEQVTINIGENVPVPAPPEGHRWAEVRHDNTVTWLATWSENINKNVKYVFLAAGSSFKGQSDLKKYEKARTLKGCIKDIRKKYESELRDELTETRQRATAMYFIDRFALRAGNEKGEDEADTVGCCSLRYEHVSLKPPNTVIFDFLGKDSIRYYNEVEVIPQVFKNLKIFKKEKNEEDMIFDRLNTLKLNKHLTSLMPGLSAKVFRTYNASSVFQDELRHTPKNASVADKILAYNRANRQVAVLCNHQRTVSKAHNTQMEKIEDKAKDMKYQKMRLKRMMLHIDEKLKQKSELLEYESEIDDDWISEHHIVLFDREVEKIKKKFEKDNEKLVNNDEKPMIESELKERLEAAQELKTMYAKEIKSGTVESKPSATIEKLEQQIAKMDDRINAIKNQIIDKDENKTTALGTSKINYIDPRLTFAWCAKFDVPVEKMFPKTLRDKFKWAADTSAGKTHMLMPRSLLTFRLGVLGDRL